MNMYICIHIHIHTHAHTHDRVGYEWVEALGWTRKETQEGERADEWYYHWKSEELVLHNPSALVSVCVAVWCSELQCVLQRVAVCCSVLR